MIENEFLAEALNDYSFLINRNYPARGSLKLVSDRYGLSGRQRSILYRGVFNAHESLTRSKKLITKPADINAPLLIDGFNVLVMMSSYLQGIPVFISTDGLLRDASGKRGEIHERKKIPEAINLLMGYLSESLKSDSVIFLDNNVRGFSDVVEQIKSHRAFSQLSLNFDVSAIADRELVKPTQGTLCTSDSEIIDKSSLPVFDLSLFVLDDRFDLRLPDLRHFG